MHVVYNVQRILTHVPKHFKTTQVTSPGLLMGIDAAVMDTSPEQLDTIFDTTLMEICI